MIIDYSGEIRGWSPESSHYGSNKERFFVHLEIDKQKCDISKHSSISFKHYVYERMCLGVLRIVKDKLNLVLIKTYSTRLHVTQPHPEANLAYGNNARGQTVGNSR